MSTVRRRRTAATALAATALLTLGGCGTSFNAQTNQVYQAGVGANHYGHMDALNTLAVANDDGTATLSVAIANNTEDEQTITSVTATTLDGGKQLKVQGEDSTSLKPGVSTLLGASDTDGFWIDGAAPGDYVKVTISFSDAAPVTVQAPVVARSSEYADVATAPAPEPTATPTETESTDEPADDTETDSAE